MCKHALRLREEVWRQLRLGHSGTDERHLPRQAFVCPVIAHTTGTGTVLLLMVLLVLLLLLVVMLLVVIGDPLMAAPVIHVG